MDRLGGARVLLGILFHASWEQDDPVPVGLLFWHPTAIQDEHCKDRVNPGSQEYQVDVSGTRVK